MPVSTARPLLRCAALALALGGGAAPGARAAPADPGVVPAPPDSPAAAPLATGDDPARTAALFATAPIDAGRLAAQAPPALAALGRARVLALDFTQARFIPGVPRALTAQGDVLLARDQGLAWRTAGARASEFVLTPTGAFTRGPDGVAHPLPPQAQAATAETARVLFPLLALDLPKLAERFTLYWSAGPDGWRLGLVPKAGTTLPFSRILVRGAGQLSGVQLFDTRGGETRLAIERVRPSPSPPTAAERARLGLG